MGAPSLSAVCVLFVCVAAVLAVSASAGGAAVPAQGRSDTASASNATSLCVRSRELTDNSTGVVYTLRTDLTPLAGDFAVYSEEPQDPPGYEYQVSLCRPFPAWSQCADAKEDRPAAVIQRRPPSSTKVLCKNCGSFGMNTTLEYINDDPYQGVILTYRNGQPYSSIKADRKSIISIYCDPSVPVGESTLSFLGENKALGYYSFSLNSTAACPKEIRPPTPDPGNNGGDDNSNLVMYILIGVGVGGAALVALIIVVIVLARKNRKLFLTFKEREAKEMATVKNPYAQVQDV